MIEEFIDEQFFLDDSENKSEAENKSAEANFSDMFSFRQIGSAAKYVEPVNSSTPLETLAQMFKNDPNLEAVPVEEYDRVIGVIDRNTVVENTNTAFKRFMGKDAGSYVKRSSHILYARDFIEKKLTAISRISREAGIIYFPVFNNRSFFGIISIDNFLERIAQMREQDMEKARTVQQNLLPDLGMLGTHPFKIGIWNRMSNIVGGDFYAAEKISDSFYICACFDVAGKNYSAALLTVALGSFFSAIKQGLLSAKTPAELTGTLDLYLKEVIPVGNFITGALCFIDTEHKSVTIHNCGHTTVYVFAPKQSNAGEAKKTILASIEPALPPFGVGRVSDLLHKGTPEQGDGKTVYIFAYTPGMHINMYSDGITDMQNPDGIRYDEQQTKRFFTELYKKDASELSSFAEKTVDNWLQEAMQGDDITLMDIRF
ncbi:SpoIIE family protein phosphatase [Treponema sp. HNW]|uniref:SpoIIE family protein phosphatase n=1 Tax=Treponema sp. HNW TaxID=3116654 RepID=UPI003D11C8F4